MATVEAIAQLRRNVADDEPVEDQAWSDIELGARLDAHNGSVERATLDCYQELWAEAAALSDYSSGTVSEKGSQIAAQLKGQVAYWAEIVAGLDSAAQAAAQASMGPQTVAVPVQVVF